MVDPIPADSSTDLSDSSTEVSDSADITGNLVPSIACRSVTITFNNRQYNCDERSCLATEEVS